MTTTSEQISGWAGAGESETMEFKKSTAEKDRACRTLCAFANGQGGRVLFGVTPSGKVVGQMVADRTLEELAQEFQGFEPPLFPCAPCLAAWLEAARANGRPPDLQSADAGPCVLPTPLLAFSRRSFWRSADTGATLAHGPHARTDSPAARAAPA